MEQEQRVFHAGETALQRRAEVPAEATAMAASFIRPTMPGQHREFFESLPALLLGLLDDQGRPWATAAFGAPGFAKAPDDRRLRVDAKPSLAADLKLDLQAGAKIGLLGIELATRRRNRVNGTLTGNAGGGFEIAVDQSFGHCPQYIQARVFTWDDTSEKRGSATRLEHVSEDALSPEAKRLIEQADTIFIASRAAELSDEPKDGVDVSHRGGLPGFLGLNDDGTLSFPDFSGNRFFNTLGNIEADGRIGLLVPDFETGDALFITGRASVDWTPERVQTFEGAERIIDITPEEIWLADHAIPARTMLLDRWPGLETTGNWRQARINGLKKDGYRGFRLARKERESDVITSFYLEPADGGPVEDHIAGQFLPIRLKAESGDPILRTYTISQAPNGRDYRLSVKREAKGAASRHLHDDLEVGDVIETATPAGDFVLDDSDQPIVMLSAGVGITPMMAMLQGQLDAVQAGGKPRPVWFMHAAQNGESRAFRKELEALADEHDWLTLHTVYSAPNDSDVLGQTFDAEGRLSVDTLRDLLPFGAYHFYICGPEGFMRALYQGLRETGIDRSHIHYEFFGAGTLGDDEETEAAPKLDLPERTEVTFKSTDVTAEWTPESGTLLDLAEAAGLSPAFNCRSGKCGTCATGIAAGKVQYEKTPMIQPPAGKVLTCCALPADDEPIILDL